MESRSIKRRNELASQGFEEQKRELYEERLAVGLEDISAASWNSVWCGVLPRATREMFL